MSQEIEFTIPNSLQDKIEISGLYANHGVNGNVTSYGLDLEFPELKLHKQVKSREFHLIAAKVETTLAGWEKKYQRHVEITHKNQQTSTAEDRNREAREMLMALAGILEHTLGIDDAVDWESLKRKDSFSVKPSDLVKNLETRTALDFDAAGRPTGCRRLPLPAEPDRTRIARAQSFFVRVFQKTKIDQKFAEAKREWHAEIARVVTKNDALEHAVAEYTRVFDQRHEAFKDQQKEDHAAVDALRARYESKEPDAVQECCDLVLAASEYPDEFPKSWDLEYREASSMVVVHYDLPAPDDLPTVESHRYVASRKKIVPKFLTEAARKKLFNSVAYQVALRTIHELFEADTAGAIDTVVFNGIVTHVNPATGITESKLILSVSASKEDFLAFDLSRVDPKATFKHLKGVAAANLMELSPIPPIVQLEKSDKRFVEGVDVVEGLDESSNLAAMDWEMFEHLVRELFEKEFGQHGGEVKVTRASADGGVDAIAFDPDPIRGGKVVIQAKRYTNTVGVEAVRDLYGTVVNEGATKGILVTTSDFGPGSHDFAKGKPISLINGNNLLALLEKHGHRARINLAEARKLTRK